jgi:hypothetical protein
MGNCCKAPKDEQTVTKPVAETGTLVTDDRSQRKKVLQIVCTSAGINLSIPYRNAIPIQDIKEQISSEISNFDISKYSLFINDLEILDATATLHQLGILPGDTLTLKLIEVSEYSEDIIASEAASISEPRDEVLTHEITGVTAKKGLASRNNKESYLPSPRKPAKELWRTALPSPPAKQLIKCDPLDASSLTNKTQEKSLNSPKAAFQVKIPARAVMESDDSNLEDHKNHKSRDNAAYFNDLQGPFFMFQKE